MRKFRFVFVAIVIVCTMFSASDAQLAIRAGGGLIFDGSQPGGHVSLILPFSDKPAGLMVAVDYYKKDGVTTVPISGRGLYNIPAGEKADIYLGVGSGFLYSKDDSNTTSNSSTKALISAVGGLKIKTSDKFGIFGEVSFDRALTSGASNDFSGKAGLFISFIE